MEKYTIPQLKDALIELHARDTLEAFAAYQLCFTELEKRLTEEQLDTFLDTFLDA